MVKSPHYARFLEGLGDRYAWEAPLSEAQERLIMAGSQRGDGGRPVVAKFVHVANERYWPRAKMLFAHSSPAATLKHPALVHVIEQGVDEPQRLVYVVMERIEGPTIGQYFAHAQRELTVGAVLHQLRQVASGIDTMHQAGLIHRDIKPSNILFCQKRLRPQIIDFGLTLGRRQIEEQAEANTWGTPAYIAPEQVIGTSYGPEVDIYAFAMTIYVLFTRQMAYDVPTARDLIYAQMHLDPIPLRRRNRAWPHELEAVLQIALSKNPALRPSTATQLVEHVARTLESYTPFRLSSFFDGSLTTVSSEGICIEGV